MKRFPPCLAAAGFAVALSFPASATTFPTLTTIYVGTGVLDDELGGANVATTFHCSNVSGVSAQVRFLVLNAIGGIAANVTTTLEHGRTYTTSTHHTVIYDEESSLASGGLFEGAVNIESTQSGVFCSAKTVDAVSVQPIGIIVPLVRVNPHPGTVE